MNRLETAAPSRRRVIKTGLAIATANIIGFPSIGRAADTIKIGILQPLSGGLEALGEQGFQGATLAIDEANDKGGACSVGRSKVSERTTRPIPRRRSKKRRANRARPSGCDFRSGD